MKLSIKTSTYASDMKDVFVDGELVGRGFFWRQVNQRGSTYGSRLDDLRTGETVWHCVGNRGPSYYDDYKLDVSQYFEENKA